MLICHSVINPYRSNSRQIQFVASYLAGSSAGTVGNIGIIVIRRTRTVRPRASNLYENQTLLHRGLDLNIAVAIFAAGSNSYCEWHVHIRMYAPCYAPHNVSRSIRRVINGWIVLPASETAACSDALKITRLL